MSTQHPQLRLFRIEIRPRRRLHRIDWNEEFGRRRRNRPRPRCSNCMERPSVGRCRFGTHLCHDCEDVELKFIQTTHRNELAPKPPAKR